MYEMNQWVKSVGIYCLWSFNLFNYIHPNISMPFLGRFLNLKKNKRLSQKAFYDAKEVKEPKEYTIWKWFAYGKQTYNIIKI